MDDVRHDDIGIHVLLPFLSTHLTITLLYNWKSYFVMNIVNVIVIHVLERACTCILLLLWGRVLQSTGILRRQEIFRHTADTKKQIPVIIMDNNIAWHLQGLIKRNLKKKQGSTRAVWIKHCLSVASRTWSTNNKTITS